ncbi:MAG: hypothetical protein AB7P49_20650, partial [Bdellovibrionales bacterium]
IGNAFDVVLGNPPWVGRGKTSDGEIEKWIFSDKNPFLSLSPKAKEKRKAIFFPQNQVAHAFMWKAPIHLKVGRTGCLLLPTKVLLNKTDFFQRYWFLQFRVDFILQLADYSFVLFPEADCPSFVIRFCKSTPQDKSHQIEYVVPKVRLQDPRSGLIPIYPEDR